MSYDESVKELLDEQQRKIKSLELRIEALELKRQKLLEQLNREKHKFDVM